jgi:hypothetical protein
MPTGSTHAKKILPGGTPMPFIFRAVLNLIHASDELAGCVCQDIKHTDVEYVNL